MNSVCQSWRVHDTLITVRNSSVFHSGIHGKLERQQVLHPSTSRVRASPRTDHFSSSNSNTSNHLQYNNITCQTDYIQHDHYPIVRTARISSPSPTESRTFIQSHLLLHPLARPDAARQDINKPLCLKHCTRAARSRKSSKRIPPAR